MPPSFRDRYLPRTAGECLRRSGQPPALLRQMDQLRAARASFLVVGGASAGKSTLLRLLHQEDLLRPEHGSLRLSALLDAVSANSCRRDLPPFCQSRRPRQLVVDDVDALPPAVQHILAALLDRFRAPAAAGASSRGGGGGTVFVFSCTTLAKVLPALRVRLALLELAVAPAAAVAAFAADVAAAEGLRFAPGVWPVFVHQHCGGDSGGGLRAALSALERLSLLAAFARENDPAANHHKTTAAAVLVPLDWVLDDKTEVWRTLLADASGAACAAAFRSLLAPLGQGYALADLLDFFFVHVRDDPDLDDALRYQWVEWIGRAMRGLPPPPPPSDHIDDDHDRITPTAAGHRVPWFSVLAATEKSLL